MSNRIYRYCKTCGNVTVADAGYYAGSSFYQCETCGRRGTSDIFPPATVFHQITTSIEVLAETLVFTSYFEDCHYRVRAWKSVFFLQNRYRTKEEAIAATVAKLKEVAE